jgi:hypothetical protein
MIYALAERAHLPLAALVLVAGLALAAGARDLMKRLLGAGVATIAGAAYLVALAPEASAGAGLAAVVLLLAAGALGVVLIVRMQEAFGGADMARIRKGLDEDAAALEAEAP